MLNTQYAIVRDNAVVQIVTGEGTRVMATNAHRKAGKNVSAALAFKCSPRNASEATREFFARTTTK